MDPQRWARIESLYHAALAKAPDERPEYVAAACREEPDLRRELESLLGFANAELLSPVAPSERLSLGAHLGSYEIVSLLGIGGMGEVYRARDTRLKRDVALKVLPEAFAHNPDRLARFQREAEVLASLNHPNIAHIYGIEERALIMEFVDGESPEGPMPLQETLKIAVQLAAALDYAHEKGIIHRDLKPANIKITREGTVKLLDFGLAAVAVDVSSDQSATTVTLSPSRPGMILGTAAYMSPEQARGQKVDRRADIWAFGVVLYELLTGKQAFQGETISDTLAAVLKEVPDLERIPYEPRRLLRACMDKDIKQRLQAIADWRLLLDHRSGSEVFTSKFSRTAIVWAVAAVLGVVALIPSFLYFWRPAPDSPVIRSEISPPEKSSFAPSPPALSPDGRWLAFSAQSADGKVQVWVRSLDTLAAQPLAGTDNGRAPFWSPDGNSIGFFADGNLKKIAAAGGPVLNLARAGRGSGTWNASGVIVFNPGPSGLVKISAAGGIPTPLTKLDRSKENSHRWPWFLPDGNHFVFLAASNSGLNQGVLRLGALDSPETQVLTEADSNAIYAQGHLLFLRGNTLIAQPFDLRQWKLVGEGVPLAEHVQVGPDFAAFSVSANGEIVYAVAGVAARLELAWFDRSGKRVGTLGEPAEASRLVFAPDHKRLTISLIDASGNTSGNNNDIWIFDLARGLRNRFSFDPAQELYGVWSPDGKSIVFNSNRRGHFDLYRKLSNGAGAEELLYADTLEKYPTSWSSDGRSLLYYALNDPSGGTLWILPDPLGPAGSAKPHRLLPTPSLFGQFSPDGKWIAYASNESGRFEVYATPFPGPGGKRQISATGGSFPRWRSDGKELYYLTSDGRLTAVEVAEDGASLEVGKITASFDTSVQMGNGFPYDVSADGQRFLMIVPTERPNSEPLRLVQNWTAALK